MLKDKTHALLKIKCTGSFEINNRTESLTDEVLLMLVFLNWFLIIILGNTYFIYILYKTDNIRLVSSNIHDIYKLMFLTSGRKSSYNQGSIYFRFLSIWLSVCNLSFNIYIKKPMFLVFNGVSKNDKDKQRDKKREKGLSSRKWVLILQLEKI